MAMRTMLVALMLALVVGFAAGGCGGQTEEERQRALVDAFGPEEPEPPRPPELAEPGLESDAAPAVADAGIDPPPSVSETAAPGSEPEQPESRTDSTPEAVGTPAEPDAGKDDSSSEAEGPVVPTVAVKALEPVGGVAEIRVKSGKRVRFVVKSDVPDEVHVHTYDISVPVAPGKPARFAFTADIEGIFEVELENAGVEVVTLRVEP